MTNSKLHSALMITFSIVLLQVPDNGSSQNQTESPEISSPEPTEALLPNFVIFGIVIGSIGALMLVSAIAISIHNFFGTESSDNERLTEEAVPYLRHHHHHPHGGPPNRAGIGGTAAAAAHSKTPQKKHKRPSKSTGHGKTSISTSTKPKSAPSKPKPHTQAKARRPTTAGHHHHHHQTITLIGPPLPLSSTATASAAHSSVVGSVVGCHESGAGHHPKQEQPTVLIPPPPARSPKPKAPKPSAKPAKSAKPRSAKPRSAKPRSAKPRSKANPFLKLKLASKVCPRSSKVCPKPTSKTSLSGGGSGSSMTSEANGGSPQHETMITSKCRPSVFFEKLRAKLAKKEKEQNAVKKRR